ncbi:hypothetical protein VTJ49DRAFT_2161 [Mycothermus thermophilus]|uniref:CCHC-type domain-containing protein n=1 Tax=Humicola insolens TaxID=85995 RepID=A0ABR3VN45_HUMIN
MSDQNGNNSFNFPNSSERANQGNPFNFGNTNNRGGHNARWPGHRGNRGYHQNRGPRSASTQWRATPGAWNQPAPDMVSEAPGSGNMALVVQGRVREYTWHLPPGDIEAEGRAVANVLSQFLGTASQGSRSSSAPMPRQQRLPSNRRGGGRGGLHMVAPRPVGSTSNVRMPPPGDVETIATGEDRSVVGAQPQPQSQPQLQANAAGDPDSERPKKRRRKRTAGPRSRSCANCGREGHQVKDCVSPRADGYVHGCPKCNHDGHQYEQCYHFDESEALVFLVFSRPRHPQILASVDAHELWEEKGRPVVMDLPWTREFGVRIAQRDPMACGDFNPDSFEYKGCPLLNAASLPLDPESIRKITSGPTNSGIDSDGNLDIDIEAPTNQSLDGAATSSQQQTPSATTSASHERILNDRQLVPAYLGSRTAFRVRKNPRPPRSEFSVAGMFMGLTTDPRWKQGVPKDCHPECYWGLTWIEEPICERDGTTVLIRSMMLNCSKCGFSVAANDISLWTARENWIKRMKEEVQKWKAAGADKDENPVLLNPLMDCPGCFAMEYPEGDYEQQTPTA